MRKRPETVLKPENIDGFRMVSSFHHEWEKCSKIAIGVAVTAEKIYNLTEKEATAVIIASYTDICIGS